MKCEIGSCKNISTIEIVWGLYEPCSKIKEKYKKRDKKKDSDYYDLYGEVELDSIYEEG